MIVNKGKGIATGTPESLQQKLVGSAVLEVVLKFASVEAADAVGRLAFVRSLNVDGPRLLIALDDPNSATPEIVDAVVQAGGQVISVNPLKPSMEDLYLKLIREADR